MFYVLKFNWSDSPFSEFKSVGKISRELPPVCDICGDRLGPLKRIAPHRYKVCGNKLGDLLTDRSGFAFSQRFIESFLSAGLTGPCFSDFIDLNGSSGKYSIVTPAYTYTLLDPEASGVDVEAAKGCPKCGKIYRRSMKRLRILGDTWNGEDLFYLANAPGLIVASEKFYKLVNEGGFTNFHLIPQDEFSEDFS